MFRRLIILAVVALRYWPSLVRSGLRRARQGSRRRQDDDHLRRRPSPRSSRARTRSQRLDAASFAGEFYYHVTRDRLRPVRRPDRPLPRRGLQRLELQGERCVASSRGRPGDDQGGRHGALVLVDLHSAGRLADARAQAPRKARNCYTVLSQNDLGQATPAAGATPARRRTTRRDPLRASAVVGRHRGSRACNGRGRGSLERALVRRGSLAALALVLLASGCGHERAGWGAPRSGSPATGERRCSSSEPSRRA